MEMSVINAPNVTNKTKYFIGWPRLMQSNDNRFAKKDANKKFKMMTKIHLATT